MTNINETLAIRGSCYGDFSVNSKVVQDLEDIIRKTPNYEKLPAFYKEAFHMIFHKMARCLCGDFRHLDNIHDVVGYSKLLEDAIKKQKEQSEEAPF